MPKRLMPERKPTDDESRLWRQATTNVAPPKRRSAKLVQKPAPVAQSAPERFRDMLDAPPSRAKSATAGERAVSPPSDHRRTPGLDKATATRLRRGQIPIDRRIDLHGMTRAEAHRVVIGALAAVASEGTRCLLVITGKGTRRLASPGDRGDPGVLRSELPRWLAEAPHRDRVLAVAPALPEHGGAGAVYVLLRRQR